MNLAAIALGKKVIKSWILFLLKVEFKYARIEYCKLSKFEMSRIKCEN